MPLDEVKVILAAHREELTAMGVVSLWVFGSVARGEAGPESDLDLLVELDPTTEIDLVDFYRLQDHLAHLLGQRIDLVEPSALKSSIREHVLQETILAA